MVASGRDVTVLLVVDQFEDVFTLAEDGTATSFLAVLGEAAADPNGRLWIVLTLRADHFDRPLAHGGFADHLRSGTELVVTLTADELERAIAGPRSGPATGSTPGWSRNSCPTCTTGRGHSCSCNSRLRSSSTAPDRRRSLRPPTRS